MRARQRAARERDVVSRQVKLGLALAAAVVLAVALIAASVIATREGDTKTFAPGATLPGADEVGTELRGIPQQRLTLGRDDAPVTLVEYADLQCPFCAQWAVNVFPELVRDYIRAGKVRLEWRGLAFIGPDSVDALRAVDAAALQNRVWHLAEIVYLNQGGENKGWVTDDFIRAAARGIPRLDVEKLMADRDSRFVGEAITHATEQARAAGVRQTPSFEIGRTGEQLRLLQFSKLEPKEFEAAVEEQLSR
jgi:protein-disulfide isomerase